MGKDKKKLKERLQNFKNSGLAQIIKTKAPGVLKFVETAMDTADDYVPALSIVTNALSKVNDIISPEDKEMIMSETQTYSDEETKMWLADVQDARDMYKTTGHTKADQIATSVIKWNLWIILGLVLVNTMVIWLIDGKVAAVVASIISLAIGNLFQERNTVIGFFFGSSQGSKDKDGHT